MESTSRPARAMVTPIREDGRRRVEALLQAATAVFRERGYRAATMTEIAARADARIGSLYRFFPDKEAVAEALVQRYVALVLESFGALRGQVEGLSRDAFSDLLVRQLVELRPRAGAIMVLLEDRPEGRRVRSELQSRMMAAIGEVLLLYAPGLAAERVPDMAAVLLNAMKIMAGLHTGEAPGGPGAKDELRLMMRLYLRDRLEGAEGA